MSVRHIITVIPAKAGKQCLKTTTIVPNACRHSRESGNPLSSKQGTLGAGPYVIIPAKAGMHCLKTTTLVPSRMSSFPRERERTALNNDTGSSPYVVIPARAGMHCLKQRHWFQPIRRHSRESGNPVSLRQRHRLPAFVSRARSKTTPRRYRFRHRTGRGLRRLASRPFFRAAAGEHYRDGKHRPPAGELLVAAPTQPQHRHHRSVPLSNRLVRSELRRRTMLRLSALRRKVPHRESVKKCSHFS